MSINVYGVDDDNEVIYPLPVSSTLVSDRHLDLLLFERDGVQQYTTIRKFSRWVGRQLSGHTVHCCMRCLHGYSSQELLDDHALDCCDVQRTRFPKDSRCRFTNIQKQLLAPFVVYADFESILQRVDEDEAMDTTQGVAVGGDEPTPAGPFQEHLPCRFAYKLVSSVVQNFTRPLVSYRGEDAGEMRDTLPRQPISVECGIVNLNTSSQPGSHWVCYYRNKSDRIYFNSSGNSTVSKDWYRVRSW